MRLGVFGEVSVRQRLEIFGELSVRLRRGVLGELSVRMRAVPTSGALKVGYSAMNTDGLEEFLDDLCLDQHTTSVEALLRAASAIPDGGSPTGRKDISGVSIFDLPRFCRLTGLGITPDQMVVFSKFRICNYLTAFE